jgi:hypothetical protein
MKRFIEVNNLDVNQNIVHPLDEIEKGLNLLEGVETVRKKDHFKVLKGLWALLEKTRQKIYPFHELKQGLIYELIGEHYLKAGEANFAYYCLEIAGEMLENYQFIREANPDEIKIIV